MFGVWKIGFLYILNEGKFSLKILTVVGARPQFIKAACVSRAIANRSHITEVIVHTGQHFDENMSDIFFKEMGIPQPTYNLGISALSHGAMTGKMLESIEEIILVESPDWVLVYGDTNSTLAGALAASKLHIKVAHVEAGLRSFNMRMPEEQNRILTDLISTVLFCPTDRAVENLFNEGFQTKNVEVVNVGDVMLDAAMFYGNHAVKPDWFDKQEISTDFVLATLHRAENTDDPAKLREIAMALNQIHKQTTLILPLHPRTKQKLDEFDISLHVFSVAPVSYLEMCYLLKNCKYVMTDSGGLQKESYFFKKPCLILRDETEWIELVTLEANKLIGPRYNDIIDASVKFNQEKIDFQKDLYGTGDTAERVVEYLTRYQNRFQVD